MRERASSPGIGFDQSGYLFADADGRPWRPDVCTNRFGRLRNQLGFRTVRLHDLRHFVATALVDGGTPIASPTAVSACWTGHIVHCRCRAK
jgi:hypothetical protein